jgi:allantoicase
MKDFEKLIDLAAERLGGGVIHATDDFFAPKENLLKPGRGEFIPGKYTENGKWMDGWESRRRRGPGHDFCIVRLGLPGVVRGFDVDTNHFIGNAPKSVSFEAACLDGYRPLASVLEAGTGWRQIVAETEVKPGSQNLIETASAERVTHLRFHIYPDGGVARLRAYGEVTPDWARILADHKTVDLAAVEHGGLPIAASNEFFSEKRNLVMPGRSRDMGDGWETKRRRGPGNDWVVVRLGRPGRLSRMRLETTHFKGNFPESASLEAVHAPSLGSTEVEKAPWRELLARTKLEADADHDLPLADLGPVTHVRLSIFPDGGVARLRLLGTPE